LPLTLTHEDGVLAATTRDLSASGAYCTLRRFIPPMTKLQIQLHLSTRSQPTRIACQGVVVRVKPPTPRSTLSRYQLAIFFNDIADRDRARLARYIDDHLNQPGRRHR